MLTDQQLLVWMPAHLARSMVGESKLSNGQRLSTVDWRANRLVDALAKLDAALRELPAACVKLLDSAECAVKHSAKLLARVTHAANNHRISECDENGVTCTRTIRDATPAPKGHKRKAVTMLPQRAATKQPRGELKVKAWVEPATAAVSKTQPVTLHNARVKRREEACTMRRVDEIGAGLSSSSVPASTRLEALERRVRARMCSAAP